MTHTHTVSPDGARTELPPRTTFGALLVAGLLLLAQTGVRGIPAPAFVLVPLTAMVLVDGYTWIGAAVVVLGLGGWGAWLVQQGDVLQCAWIAAFGVGGIAMALAAGRGFGPFVGSIVGALPPAAVSVTLFATNGLGFHDAVRTQLTTAWAAMKTAGYVPPQLSNTLPTMFDVYMTMYPMLLCLALLCAATAVFMLAEVLIPLIGRPALHDGRFRCWKLPDGAPWLLIAGLGLALVQREPATSVGLNLSGIMVTLYGAVGLAIVRFFLLAWGLPTAVQVCITGGMLVLSSVSQMPLVPAFVIALGFLDTWMDFRGLETPPMHAGEGNSVP